MWKKLLEKKGMQTKEKKYHVVTLKKNDVIKLTSMKEVKRSVNFSKWDRDETNNKNPFCLEMEDYIKKMDN